MRVGIAVAALAAGLISLTGCGSDTSVPNSGPTSVPLAEPRPSAGGTTVDVTIAEGVVSPTNEQLEVVVGEDVTVRITSDVDEELHVHSVPEHTFDISAGADAQLFTFAVDVPGKVALELHESGKTVTTLLVRP